MNGPLSGWAAAESLRFYRMQRLAHWECLWRIEWNEQGEVCPETMAELVRARRMYGYATIRVYRNPRQ